MSEPQLSGQTVVVLGGSAGIGLETARLARAVCRDRKRSANKGMSSTRSRSGGTSILKTPNR